MKIIGPSRFLNSVELRRLGLRCGDDVQVHETALLVDVDNIEIGSNVRIDQGCTLSAAGGSIRLGSYIHIAAGACVYGAAGVILEDFSGLSHGVKLYSASDDYSGRSLTNPTVPHELLKLNAKPVHLGRHVIVGAGSIILPGANIGEGSAVGALSLVTKPLEPWGIYSGIPARRIAERRKDLLADEGRASAVRPFDPFAMARGEANL